MEVNFIIIFFTLALVLESGLCQEGVCSISRGVIDCCIDYREISGTCILCPEGYHGWNCNMPCPSGLYGKACRKFCECEGEQTCDPMRGCVLNLTEIYIAVNATTTIQIHFTDTRQNYTTPNDLAEAATLKYLLLTPGGVVFVLVVVWLFVSYRKKIRAATNGVQGSFLPDCEVNVEGAIQEVLPPSDGPNWDEMSSSHEYIEIIDVDSTYLEPCNLTTT